MKKRILIIEDDKVVAGVYRQRFIDEGYLVDLAPDGLEGVKLVTAVKPDVVLLDLLMPRLDGIEVLKFIRSHPDVKHMPVVVFSNSFMTNLVEAAWRAGADQCLMKASTTPTQLFDAINKAMAKGAARKAAAPAPVSAVDPLSRPIASPAPAPLVAPLPPSQVPPNPAPRPVVPKATPAPPPAAPAPKAPPPAQRGTAYFTAPERSATPIHAEADPEFQAQIRQLFLSSSTTKLGSIRNLATSFVQGESGMQQAILLTELFRKIHSMTGNAALAGCGQIAEFASTFEALLQELLQQPAFINASTRRTVAKSVDFLELQFHSTGSLDAESSFEEKVLVLEADPVSAKNIQQTLSQLALVTEMSVDAAEALGLMASGPYSLVIVPADMPGISGFELFAQMQSLPGHGHTPAVFLTGFENFHAHTNPEVLGDNDVLAKPYLGIELILKAVMSVQRRLYS